ELSRTLARPQFERLGWKATDGESESDTKLRSLVIGLMLYGEDKATEAYCKELFARGIESIDPELRHLVIASAVKYASDPTVISDLQAHYKTTQSADLRDDICSGLTSARHPEYISTILGAITDSTVVRRQDVFRWFAYLIRNRYARQVTWDWMMSYWDWI